MKDFTLELTLDTIGYPTKPESSELKLINKRLTAEELTFADFVAKIQSGYSWCPATFANDKRSNVNFQRSQVLTLDFDGGISPSEVIERSLDLGILPSIIYHSFSSNPTEGIYKFRVVWILDQYIQEAKVYQNLIKGLMLIFPEADKSCKDAARLFFGTNQSNELVLVREALTPLGAIELAINALEVSLATEDGKSKKAQKLTKNDKPFNSYSECQNSSDFEDFELRAIDYSEDGDLSHLFIFHSLINGGRFIEGEGLIEAGYQVGERLHYPEILGLALNLQYMRGGLKFLKQAMEAAGCFEQYHFSALYQVRARKPKYLPQRLENFSPYIEDHNYLNMIQATGKGLSENSIVDLWANNGKLPSNLKLYSLESATQELTLRYHQALNTTDTKIYVFRCATGLGKTELLTSTLGNFGYYTYAFPTNKLKLEFGERSAADRFANLAVVTPELPKNLDRELAVEVEYLQTIGCWKESLELLKASEFGATDEYKEYQKGNAEAYGSKEKSIITTHFKALARNKDGNFPFGHTRGIVFDEDPINSLIQIDQVKRECLLRLIADLRTSEQTVQTRSLIAILEEIVDYINKGVSRYQETPQYELSGEQFELLQHYLVKGFASRRFESNILGYFLSNYSVLDDAGNLFYCRKLDLPEDKKVLVFSATADEFIWKTLYGDRVEFIDVSNVISEGKLEHLSDYSCSRASLSNKRVLKAVVDEVGTLPVITFRSYKNNFDNPAEAHFGNCSGYDQYKGQDLAVVGVPHLPEFVYKLFALALGVKLQFGDNKMSIQFVQRNGYRFRLRTFNRTVLQNIQAYFIERDLIQAVGRARLLRFLCSVKLVGNYPIRQYFKGDWLDYVTEEPAQLSEINYAEEI